MATRKEIEDVEESKGRIQSIQPKCFSGTNGEDVKEFLKSYRRTAKANKWSNQTKLLQLPCILRDASLNWFESVEEGDINLKK
ncbi:hypothetical protein Trydic_g21406 [Trypoxylus dichotomus]